MREEKMPDFDCLRCGVTIEAIDLREDETVSMAFTHGARLACYDCGAVHVVVADGLMLEEKRAS